MRRKHLLSNLLLVALIAAPPLAAQEFIREPQNKKDDYSLVRELRKDLWVIGNYYQNHTIFTLIAMDSTFYHELDQPITMLKDMEIWNENYVFFCGLWNNEPVFGFFEGEIGCAKGMYCPYLKQLCGLSELKKMELYVREQMHVVMTGTKYDGSSCIVDAIFNFPAMYPYPQTCNIHIGQETNRIGMTFDDIAITDKFIAVTARYNNGGIIYLFDKTASSFIFSLNSLYSYFYVVNDTLLITKCTENTVATATKMQGTASIKLTAVDLATANHLGSCDINYSIMHDHLRLRDITYDIRSRCIKVLSNDTSSKQSQAVPVELIPNIVTGIVSGHVYLGNTLSSIRPSHHHPDSYAASGHKSYGNILLRLYAFQHLSWLKCSEKLPFTLTPITNYVRPYYFCYITKTQFAATLLFKENCYRTGVITNICPK